MKALILAGGEGKRLKPMTNDRPKPMLEVGGKPIIEWEILWMKQYGIRDFIVSAGFYAGRDNNKSFKWQIKSQKQVCPCHSIQL